jgi:hypothetical protein
MSMPQSVQLDLTVLPGMNIDSGILHRPRVNFVCARLIDLVNQNKLAEAQKVCATSRARWHSL